MNDEEKKKLSRLKKSELVEEIVRLTDENQSLWSMRDEMKSSDMKNYKKQFQTMIDRKIEQLHLLAKKPIKVVPVGKKGKSWFQWGKND